jgi:hypothetical protein
LAATASAYDDHFGRMACGNIEQGLGNVTPSSPNFDPEYTQLPSPRFRCSQRLVRQRFQQIPGANRAVPQLPRLFS